MISRIDHVSIFGYDDHPEGIWKEIFIHPRHAIGVLIQIAEFKADDWLSEQVKFPAGRKWEIQKSEDGTH